MPVHRDRSKIEVSHYGLHQRAGTWFLLQGASEEKAASLVPGIECPFVIEQYQSIRPCQSQVDIFDYEPDVKQFVNLLKDETIQQFLPLPPLLNKRFIYLKGGLEHVPVITQLMRMATPKSRQLFYMEKNLGSSEYKSLGVSNIIPFFAYGLNYSKTGNVQTLFERAVALRQRVILMGEPDVVLPPTFHRIEPDWEKLTRLASDPHFQWEKIGNTVCRSFMLVNKNEITDLIPEMQLSFLNETSYQNLETQSGI